ncbi:unnamed protein product [Ectocarpus fasciculatus]
MPIHERGDRATGGGGVHGVVGGVRKALLLLLLFAHFLIEEVFKAGRSSVLEPTWHTHGNVCQSIQQKLRRMYLACIVGVIFGVGCVVLERRRVWTIRLIDRLFSGHHGPFVLGTVPLPSNLWLLIFMGEGGAHALVFVLFGTVPRL